MRRGTRPMTIEYKGVKAVIDMPGWYCDASDESIHNGKDMRVSDQALNRLKASVDGLLSPEEIHRIRRKLRLTQETAERLSAAGLARFKSTKRAIFCQAALSVAPSSCLTAIRRDL